MIAMIAERLLFPSSKLAHTRHWHSTTLAEELDVAYATEDHLYEAMDWLLKRQGAIEKRLAQRHLREGALVLYDVTSSYYEGKTCPLARFGYDRDGKTGCPIIVYGMLTDADGRPVAVHVYQVTPRTPKPSRTRSKRSRSGLACHVWCWLAIVACSHKLRLTCSKTPWPGLDLGVAQRRNPPPDGQGPSDQAEFGSRTPGGDQLSGLPWRTIGGLLQRAVGRQRRRKRQELLASTQAELEALAASVGRAETAADIGVRAGKIINHYKMAKHFTLTIHDGYLGWARKNDAIEKEETLDGIYVIRTSEPAERLTAANGVRTYKSLALVEQSFRCLKGIDLLVRPIHHRTADRVRAHIFLCVLAFYVEWHLRQAWEPLLFEDEDLALDRKRRDPVLPAQASPSARLKKKTHQTPDGLPVQSFRTLMAHLGHVLVTPAS